MNSSLIANPYAAWRAECTKADINMGFIDNNSPIEIPKMTRKEYQHDYYLTHRNEINAKRRAKRKAACDCNHKAAKKKSYNKSLTA